MRVASEREAKAIALSPDHLALAGQAVAVGGQREGVRNISRARDDDAGAAVGQVEDSTFALLAVDVEVDIGRLQCETALMLSLFPHAISSTLLLDCQRGLTGYARLPYELVKGSIAI